MPKNHMLILVVAVAVSSTFAQDQTPSSSEKHQIVVETNSGRYGVGAEKLDPKQLGVAIYPGAKVYKRENGSDRVSPELASGDPRT